MKHILLCRDGFRDLHSGISVREGNGFISSLKQDGADLLSCE